MNMNNDFKKPPPFTPEDPNFNGRPPSKLQFWAKFIGYFDMVCLAIGAILYFVFIMLLATSKINFNDLVDEALKDSDLTKEQIGEFRKIVAIVGIVFLIIAAFGIALQFYLNYILINGAKKRNFSHTKIWLIITSILFGLSLLGSIKVIMSKHTGFIASHFLSIIYRGVTIWVVWMFHKELKTTF